MARQQQTLSRYDGRGRTLRKLNRGEPVLVQDLRAKKTQWVRGRCWDQLTDRSYTVEVDGQLLHRNRHVQFLKPSQNLPPTDTEQGVPTVDNGGLGRSDVAELGGSATEVTKVVTAGEEVTGVKRKAAGLRERTTRVDRDRTPEKETNITEKAMTGEVGGLGEQTTRSGRVSKKPSRYIEQF